MAKISTMDILMIAAANPDAIVPPEGLELLNEKGKPKRNKFNAQRTQIGTLTFDSKRESVRYVELDIMRRAGHISDLELQPTYILTGGVKYIGDFRYVEDGKTVVEDVKGGKATQTPEFKIKWKQAKELYPNIDWRIVGG